MRTHVITAAALLLAMMPAACSGIYDNPGDMPATNGGHPFAYLDATSYAHWLYLDLDAGTATTLHYTDSTRLPATWHLALHRYDVRTNGGKAIETPYTRLADLTDALRQGSLHTPPDSLWKADVRDSIVVDVSTMMDGYLGRTAAWVNKEMGKWLAVDLATMPPAYTPSNKVYLLRMADGRLAAIRFTGYSNPNLHNTKGYISLDYAIVGE